MRTTTNLLLCSALLAATASAALPALRVSPDRHFLMTEDGRPFFWLADTAWELFHRPSQDRTSAPAG